MVKNLKVDISGAQASDAVHRMGLIPLKDRASYISSLMALEAYLLNSGINVQQLFKAGSEIGLPLPEELVYSINLELGKMCLNHSKMKPAVKKTPEITTPEPVPKPPPKDPAAGSDIVSKPKKFNFGQ
jgi:hypothetical protein